MKRGSGKIKRKGLFASHINKFLKVKPEAAGWLSKCETDKKKGDFIRQVKDIESIYLDPNIVENIPG